MIVLIISGIAYLIGCCISYWMLRVEHESEKEIFTKGGRFFGVMFAILSWLMIVIILCRSWFINIGKTGYWDKPVKEELKPPDA